MKKSIFASTLISAAALVVPAFADTWIAEGDSGEWATDSNWSDGSWTDGEDATFGSGYASKVTVSSGTVTAGSVTIESGASYTFDISGTLTTGMLTNSGSLALTGSGTFKTQAAFNNTGSLVVDASEFTGTLEVDGYLDALNSNLNSSMTVVMDASSTYSGEYLSDSNSISYGTGTTTSEDYYEFAANLVLSGEGGVIFRTSNANITVSGDVTGAEGVELQKNGGGSLTFTGTVSLDTYISYQGSTTFKGSSTTLGTLEFAGDSGTTSVTFSTDASVDAITNRQANSFTGTLTVDNSATLTVGSISISHNITVVTTDDTNGNGTLIVTGDISAGTGSLVIADGSTLSATGATSEGTRASLAGIAGAGTLELNGAASKEFIVTTSDDFTGDLVITSGRLVLVSSSIASDATLILQASETKSGNAYTDSTAVSLTLGGTGVSLTNDITIEGTGGVLIRTGGGSGELSGDIYAEGAAYIQINGGQTVTLSGDVSLASGGYIAYQGSTTFSGKTVTLGSLDIIQTADAVSDVTFSGSTASVGTLTVDSTTSSDTPTLTVSNGASLTVGALVIDHNVAIAIDNAAMSITTSASQGNGASTSIVISNGGTLNIGEGVTLNATTMEIILGVENMEVVSPNSLVTYAGSDGAVYALTGSGTISDDVTITITVSEAVADLLKSGESYTFYIYDGLSIDESVFDYSALKDYGYEWNGDGTITLLPEPSMFGLMFGLGAIGLVATRRRRR